MTRQEMVAVMSSDGPWQKRYPPAVRPDTCHLPNWEDDPDPSWNWLLYDYRVKPQVQPALGPADFPPGTIIKRNHWPRGTYVLVIAASPSEITYYDHDRIIVVRYQEMKAGCNLYRSLDGGKTWLDCYRTAE